MLNSEQDSALRAAVNGHNILICGQAGTGKTRTIKTICKTLSSKRKVSLLCTTGMACLQYTDFGARTVHSWAGLYDGRYDILTLKNLVMNDEKYENVRNNVKATEVVIIDEISMLSQKLFEQLEAVCKVLHDNNKYFGGLQVILSGDIFQLPPVPDDLHNDDGKFCFESEVFRHCMTHKIVLKQVMRQEEELLVKAVRESALRSVSEEIDVFLKSLERPLPTDTNAVHLFAKNIDTTIFNNVCLGKLDAESKVYKAVKNNGSPKYLLKILAPNYLHLKITCPVILLINLGNKLVNGLKVFVKSLQDDSVTVCFPNNDQTHDITRNLFSKYSLSQKCVVAEREQFPLVLGYGSTVHKAQGMTLETVVVHCKGIFQSGQLSVAIGRSVTSNGLYLLNYRKGLCYPPKPVISQFYYTESSQYLTDFSCCSNKSNIDIKTETDTETLPTDPDSDFDLEEIEFIEQHLVEHAVDVSDTQLPEYIDVNKLKTLNRVSEPVTDLQRKINNICEQCDHIRLTNFCIKEYIRINELLCDIDSDKTTKPKEWTSILASNYKHMAGEKYMSDLKKLLIVYKLSEEHKQFGSNIVIEILKLTVRNIAQRVKLSQEHKTVHAGSLSEAGKGKIRYVGGMCVAKALQHYINNIMSNQNNPDKSIQKTLKESEVKLDSLQKLVAYRDLDCKMDKTLQEIERKQNVRKALTNITDNCFNFFLNLNGRVNKHLNTDIFKTQKMNVFEYTFCELDSDVNLRKMFSDLFLQDFTDIVHSLYKEIVHKYLMVCHKQLLKDTKDALNIAKKKAHREEITKKTEKRKSEIEISLKDIVKDTSENKVTSNMKLKLNCVSNLNYFEGKDFTKKDLMNLCSAYGVPFTTSMTKPNIANILRENIISADKVLNPDLLSADLSEPSTSAAAPPKKKCANVPSRGKGKGKGKGKSKKAVVTKYFCKICKEECLEDEECVQCDDCNLWFHRTCEDLSDEQWDDVQLEESAWTCSVCSPP